MNNDLTIRQQLVKIVQHINNIKKIECGVPQGNIIGPTLFVVYLNDFLKHYIKMVRYLVKHTTFVYSPKMLMFVPYINEHEK